MFVTQVRNSSFAPKIFLLVYFFNQDEGSLLSFASHTTSCPCLAFMLRIACVGFRGSRVHTVSAMLHASSIVVHPELRTDGHEASVAVLRAVPASLSSSFPLPTNNHQTRAPSIVSPSSCFGGRCLITLFHSSSLAIVNNSFTDFRNRPSPTLFTFYLHTTFSEHNLPRSYTFGPPSNLRHRTTS